MAVALMIGRPRAGGHHGAAQTTGSRRADRVRGRNESFPGRRTSRTCSGTREIDLHARYPVQGSRRALAERRKTVRWAGFRPPIARERRPLRDRPGADREGVHARGVERRRGAASAVGASGSPRQGYPTRERPPRRARAPLRAFRSHHQPRVSGAGSERRDAAGRRTVACWFRRRASSERPRDLGCESSSVRVSLPKIPQSGRAPRGSWNGRCAVVCRGHGDRRRSHRARRPRAGLAAAGGLVAPG